MMGSRETYEKLIKASPLFQLDRDKEPTAYKREAIKMTEYLYCYLLSVNENKYIEFGLEITDTARRCINNYNADNGEFLSYFNAAWAKEYRRAFGKRQAEQFRGGMHITEDDQILVNKYLRFIEKYTEEYDETKVIPAIAEALNISVEKVRDIIRLNSISTVSGDAINEDEETGSIFEFIGEETDEDAKYEVEELFVKIEKEFNKLQQRQKRLISKLITLKIADSLQASEELYEETIRYSFFDMEAYDMSKDGPLTNKAIASQCGVSEQSASRSLKTFIERIKEQYD